MAVAVPVVDRQVTLAFAALLSYPHEHPAGAARECEEAVRGESAEAAEIVAAFRDWAEAATLGELQEAYTRTFDLDTMSQAEPTCYPFVGHHLFEENHKRSAFILGLRKRYRAHGFEEEGELPDHIVVLLRFLAACPDEELAAELVDEGILPGIARMLGAGHVHGDDEVSRTERAVEGTARGREAYRSLVRALGLALAARRPEPEPDEEAEAARREWERHGDSLGIDRDCSH